MFVCFPPQKYYILMRAGVLSVDCCGIVSLEQQSCEARLFGNDQNVNVIVANPPSFTPRTQAQLKAQSFKLESGQLFWVNRWAWPDVCEVTASWQPAG